MNLSEVQYLQGQLAEAKMFQEFWMKQEIGEDGEPIDKEEYLAVSNQWIAAIEQELAEAIANSQIN